MLFRLNIIAVIIVANVLVIQTKKLPSKIKPCKNSDVLCISRTTQDVLHQNPNGLRELGLPKLEPFFVREAVLSEARPSSSLNLDLKLFDINVSGLSRTIIDRAVGFDSNPSTSKFEFYAQLPKLELKGQYIASGRILILPIQGKGPAYISLEKCKLSLKFKPTVTKENGLTRIGVKQLKILMEPENVKMRLDNLFNGDKALGENMNKFLNENWRDVWTELSPSINVALAGVVKTLISEVLKNFYYEEFFKN